MTSKYKYQGNPRKPKLGTEKCKCGLSEFAHKQSDYWRTNKACEKFQPEDEIVTTDYETKPEIDAFVKGFMKGKQKKGSSEDVPDCEKYDKDILGKHTLTKQKKGSSEDVPKEIINPMKDMVRNGKDWKQKGCGKDLSGNWKCGEMFEGKPLLCPSCSKSLEGKDMSGLEDTSSDNQSLSVKCKDKPEEINQIFGEKLV